MFTAILFVVAVAWLGHGFWQGSRADEDGETMGKVVFTILTAAPVDLVKWVISKF